ncbi:hypothetical protein FPV67DRAFT_1553160 [Lyophyllum atratum]|nr:hypothetical protein FPV67DRAFT_1553160 [Lyophyllum atratum]
MPSSGTVTPAISNTLPDSALLLPQITTIAPQLEKIGLSPIIARQASETYLKTAHGLRDVCETSFRNAFRKASAAGRITQKGVLTMTAAWHTAYMQQTHAWAEDAFACARDAVAKVESVAARPHAKGNKPTFNHEYTPLLEKYFEHNAYPSARDRSVLARKSMMTPRQIEVWFQNHRNRARKDGKPLRRLTEDPLPLEISLKSLKQKMSFFTVPKHERRSINLEPDKDDFSDVEDTQSTPARSWGPTAPNLLNPPRPLHAFPSLYPPRFDYDPFPCKEGTFKFPPPVWFRKPATTHRAVKIPIDMDDFIADFNTKLHMRAPVSMTRHSSSARSWCDSRVTVLPSAPHPALVRSIKPLPSLYTSRLPTVPASSSRLHPFRSPSPSSQPTTLVPPHPSNNTPMRRKVAPLPKRTPKNVSIAHRRGSPANSDASPAPSRSSSSSSRTPSFGSDASSDQRPSSSSGSSNSSSSTPATPEMPYASLSGDSPSVSVSGLDFENMHSLFGDRSLSPVDGTPFSFSITAEPKQPSIFDIVVASAGHTESRNFPLRALQ